MRKAFTLPEILIALVIMVVVSSGVLLVFQYQNKNMITQRAAAEMNLMAKGMSEELSRTVRMAGGVLPPGVGGLVTKGKGNESLTVVLNRGAGVDTTRLNSFYYPTSSLDASGKTYAKVLYLPMKNVEGVFTDSGYVVTTVMVPPYPCAVNTAPTINTMTVFKILKMASSFSISGMVTGPGIIVDASWFASRWSYSAAVVVNANTFVYALDSVKYWKSSDTVFRKINRNDAAAFAVGIDSLRLQYNQPSGNATIWADSVVPANTSLQIQKARIRMRVRTRQKDYALAIKNPSTGGYHYQIVESEVALRNASTLVNQ
jgi:prepilin-type N-terminal cleavage/methylation domain-containing protein